MATFFKSEEDKRAAIKHARQTIVKIDEQARLARELLAIIKRMPVKPVGYVEHDPDVHNGSD